MACGLFVGIIGESGFIGLMYIWLFVKLLLMDYFFCIFFLDYIDGMCFILLYYRWIVIVLHKIPKYSDPMHSISLPPPPSTLTLHPPPSLPLLMCLYRVFLL